MHDAVVTAGYDRTFDELPAHRANGAVLGASRRRRPRGRAAGWPIELDPGVRLDLGGIAKGYAADRAAGVILAAVGPCLVDAGGDIALHGKAWPVGVETGQSTITLEFPGGGIATSAATGAAGGAAAAASSTI